MAQAFDVGVNEIVGPHIHDLGRKTAGGDQMTLPLTLAGGLRTAFADVVSSPLPEHLATLMRRLSADGDARSGEERNYGANATETPRRIDRRGRR
jgi:hypothetical protein